MYCSALAMTDSAHIPLLQQQQKFYKVSLNAFVCLSELERKWKLTVRYFMSCLDDIKVIVI